MKKEIHRIIERFAAGRKIEEVPFHPEEWALPHRCFDNVVEKAKRDGREIVYGYAFFRWCREIMDAVPHVIWRDPTGSLLDITPIVAYPGDEFLPLGLPRKGDKRLFIADVAAKPIVLKEKVVEYRYDGSIKLILFPGGWTCPPSKSFALARNARREVARINQADYANTRAIMRAGERALAV